MSSVAQWAMSKVEVLVTSLPHPPPLAMAFHQLQRCPPWENGVQQCVWSKRAEGDWQGPDMGQRQAHLDIWGRNGSNVQPQVRDPPTCPGRCRRVLRLGHPREPPDLRLQPLAESPCFSEGLWGNSPEEERRNQRAGGTCGAWRISEEGFACR